MICYLCGKPIPDGEPFYNDHGKYVCKPCFNEARRCFICRFPGRDLQPVAGLGLECEFCRGHLIAEGSELESALEPLRTYLAGFGHTPVAHPRFQWRDVADLRALQSTADVAPEAFIDDFLRYAYPVYYREGVFHLLRRMTKPTFVAYMVVQLAAAELSERHRLPDLAGRTPFHTLARGWCHWLGYEAARLLGYDLERRQLRKWPELGAQGDFERWERMSRVNKPAKMLVYFQATLPALAKKHLFVQNQFPR